ncbi:hypothetical protein HDU85_006535 [Gaertneriomyces sp. JEL0708]|nr:hypothetical protein HDU85_006535 [Gaertneriomyces sp. JEL0708]
MGYTSDGRNDYEPIPGFKDAEYLRVDGSYLRDIQRIYAINLASRRDRRELLLSRLHAIDLSAYVTPGTTTASPLVTSRSGLLHDKPLGGLWPFGSHLSNGELASAMSHLRIMQDVVDKRLERALVLEDDVIFERELPALWAPLSAVLPSDADLVYLGHCDNSPSTLIAAPIPSHTLNIASHPSCVHAYLVTKAGAHKILSLLSAPQNAYDDGIGTFVDLGLVRAYSVHPPLIDQDPGSPSDLDDRSWYRSVRRVLRNISSWLRAVPQDEIKNPVFGNATDVKWARKWLEKNERGVWRATSET